MKNFKNIISEQEQNNIIYNKSILDQILDDYTDSLSKNLNFGPEVAQSLKEIIYKGEYNNKEMIIKLFKKKSK